MRMTPAHSELVRNLFKQLEKQPQQPTASSSHKQPAAARSSPGAARRSPGAAQEPPGEAQEQPESHQAQARSSQEQPRSSPGPAQEQPRSSPGEGEGHPGAARSRPGAAQEQPGAAQAQPGAAQEQPRRSPEATFDVFLAGRGGPKSEEASFGINFHQKSGPAIHRDLLKNCFFEQCLRHSAPPPRRLPSTCFWPEGGAQK